MPENLILRLGLALVIGLLVGLERGWRERDEPAGSRTAGFRTYGLSGFLGGVLAAVAQALESGMILAAGFVAFAGVFAWFKARELEREEEYSVTSVVAALGVFALGALSVAGDYRAAAAGGVALAGVLASREALHGLLRRISWVKLRATLLLAGMTAIGLSLLPNRTIDPWGGVNPWEIWFFTVLTAAISYAGNIAIRIFGPGKGVLTECFDPRPRARGDKRDLKNIRDVDGVSIHAPARRDPPLRCRQSAPGHGRCLLLVTSGVVPAGNDEKRATPWRHRDRGDDLIRRDTAGTNDLVETGCLRSWTSSSFGRRAGR
jgi:hypothetical protein